MTLKRREPSGARCTMLSISCAMWNDSGDPGRAGWSPTAPPCGSGDPAGGAVPSGPAPGGPIAGCVFGLRPGSGGSTAGMGPMPMPATALVLGRTPAAGFKAGLPPSGAAVAGVGDPDTGVRPRGLRPMGLSERRMLGAAAIPDPATAQFPVGAAIGEEVRGGGPAALVLAAAPPSGCPTARACAAAVRAVRASSSSRPLPCPAAAAAPSPPRSPGGEEEEADEDVSVESSVAWAGLAGSLTTVGHAVGACASPCCACRACSPCAPSPVPWMAGCDASWPSPSCNSEAWLSACDRPRSKCSFSSLSRSANMAKSSSAKRGASSANTG